MNNKINPESVALIEKTTALGSLENFKQGVDMLLAKRQYLISKVLPQFKEGLDFYMIKGKKSLGKSGAEKLASIYSLTATFLKDEETLSMLSGHKDIIAYVCSLITREGKPAGQGRGADSPTRNQGDINKAIKMSQKRAFIDAVIRTTGLSDIFTQDMESISPEPREEEHNEQDWVDSIFADESERKKEQVVREEPITEKQRNYIINLLDKAEILPEEKSRYLERANQATKREGSAIIRELIQSN